MNIFPKDEGKNISTTSARGNVGFRVLLLPLCPRGAMKTDPTSTIKSQLCDIRRAGSQLQNIMDGRNAAARSSIITGRLRRIVGNESSVRLSLSLRFLIPRKYGEREKGFLLWRGIDACTVTRYRNFSIEFFFPPLYHNFTIVFVDACIDIIGLRFIERRSDPPSVSMYATLCRNCIEL